MLYDSCKAFYAPGNMVLAAAGNTTMEQILAACKRHGLMEPRPADEVQRLWATEPMTLAATEKTLKMPVSKPCFGVGFKEEPLPADDLRTEALYDLALSCVVGGMSPLYRRLYDEGLVNPGFGGQSFIPGTIAKLHELKAMCERHGVSPLIEVDGGISAHNARLLFDTGADVLVAGNAVFGADDPKAEIERMLDV